MILTGQSPRRLLAGAKAPQLDEQIATLLARRCVECHNSNSKAGGLDLSTAAAALQGGESGPAIVPGKSAKSLLWRNVDSNEMPKDRPALSAEEKQLLRRWLDAGAVWGNKVIDPRAYSTERRAGYDWWSLQPVTNPPPPAAGTSWAVNDIDHFVLAKLEARRLEPAPRADRRTLVRRLYFDLIGLPPTPEAVQRFVQDESPAAYERLVDELLRSPHYGERWARHWLDVVRFGESQGFERNWIRDDAWRYRDWVVRALNRDLPYDEFVRQQIAGDVLYPNSVEALIATGYHVCGAWDQVAHLEGSAMMRVAARQDHLEDLVATLGQAFLGMTINCARCHDHKFDPISQQDYYQMAALLGGVNQEEKERQVNIVPDGDRERQLKRRLKRLDGEIAELDNRLREKYQGHATKPRDVRDGESPDTWLAAASGEERAAHRALRDQRRQLQDELGQLRFSGRLHVVVPKQPAVFHVLARGDFRNEREVAAPAGLSALSVGGLPADFGLKPDAPEDQRRVALAKWLTDRRNPLTARVFVNRLWRHHFGRGIVDTPSDFGFAGDRPSHPKLLNYLAWRFMENGWKVKDIQRLIVTSATYRQQSRVVNRAAEEIDPGNRLLWRTALRRLEGEVIRDAVLSISGALNPQIGGPSYRDVKVAGGKMGKNAEFTVPTGEFTPEVNRRTIYRLWARSGGNPMLETLDCPDPCVMAPRRTETITPLQGLALLNNSLMENSARQFARRLRRDAGENVPRQIDLAYRLAFGRTPSKKEIALSAEFVSQQGLEPFCLVLFNANEFLFVN